MHAGGAALVPETGRPAGSQHVFIQQVCTGHPLRPSGAWRAADEEVSKAARSCGECVFRERRWRRKNRRKPSWERSHRCET